MDHENEINSAPHNSFEKPQRLLYAPKNTIAIYTVLRSLLKMRKVLGLEAMLEYVGKYLEIIEKSNPVIKSAVEKALTMISVEKMYDEIFKKN